MHSVILTNYNFDSTWPLAADHAHAVWRAQGGTVEFIRQAEGDARPAGELIAHPGKVTRLISFDVALTDTCLDAMPALREVAATGNYPLGKENADALAARLASRGIRLVRHTSEGYWGQSVSEFGLALTLAALRRIPQTHHSILASHDEWDYHYRGAGTQAVRGAQFGDDDRFTSGTLEGKRVRVVGAGNIASRYASFAHFMGADVAAWDPFATEPCFHRAGVRREHFLDRLVQDAEIFAPMVPLTPGTRGLVTAAHIDALPTGALVVLVTRACVVDMPALRRRVLADELALAADVFDIEPVPLDDPLLGRPNVVHTPHNAGRTRQSNHRFAEVLLDQFAPVAEAGGAR
ncbi:hydroxyacid dehydrogenase [Verrucomicrobia bacterium LW23]|nr:hydroxyacid dehydrogenase [Verrucomicrobia bacterium LW23]